MNIIYNESIAAKHIKEQRDLKRSRQTHYVLSIPGCCAFCGCFVATVAYNVTFSPWVLWPVLLIGALSLGTLFMTMFGIDMEEDPSPDILFFEKSKGCRVLDIAIEHYDHGWHSNVPIVVLRTENASGMVEKTALCVAKYQESTRHSEETFDVNKGILYVPYKGRTAA